MSYIDESIAKKFKKERLERLRKEQEEQERAMDATIDEEEIIAGIKSGKCQIFDRVFEFEQHTVCDGRFSIYLPKEGMVIQNDLKELFKSVNDDLGFACNFASTDEKMEFQSLEFYKEKMEKGVKKVPFKWVEEGVQFIDGYKLMYLDFINLTGMVTIHQNMWFIMGPYGQAQAVVSYDHKEKKYWKHIIKALRNTLEINE